MKNTFKIFIVEDDRMYQKMLTHILEPDKSSKLYLFSSGKDCLDALGERPDIISMDYSVPDMDGTTLLSSIKSQDLDAEVVVLSGQTDTSTIYELLGLGAYDVITKDVSTKYRLINVIRRLKELIELRHQLIELSSAF